ncbi:phage tail tape measure protein [Phaeobacter piscinae]|uniref:Phage tail tape measure protein n=1 Tax=Phaeobacter piscinae TaxID=1580596 RepID=A0AAN1GR95_9RHOB|nr:phage tail tape measure protein [Phaeobacter piscinae]ATG43655.1 putative phage tail tape measure protein [Phaeobacter piscinae]
MAKQRLSASITIGGVLEKSFKKNIGLIRSGFENIGDSIKSVKTRQKELSRQRVDLVKQGRSVEALDREYEDLERTLEALARKQRRWERAMRDSRRVGESFDRMASNFGRMGRRVGAGIAAVGAGVFALASSTASYGDQVAKTAGKLGIGIEALQEYRYAAERSGVSTDTFDSSLTALQKRLGEAAKGSGAAKKALDQMGLSAKDLVAMGPERAMGQIADKLQAIENPAERAAIASALFSRAGIGMINMLGGGSEALRQLREDARKTGYVLSEKAARDAEAFADAQLDAQLTVKGLKNTIGAELMPVVTRSMKTFSAWAISNREDVADFADTAARKLKAALPVIGQVIEGMGKVSSTVGEVIGKVATMVGGWEKFGMIIGGLFAARTIGSVLSFGFAVARLGVSVAALVPLATGAGGAMGVLSGGLGLVKTGIITVGRALMMNPIGLAVGAIAGSAYLIYRHWDQVGPWFGKLWGNVKQTFSGIGGFITGVWRGDWDAAADGLSTAWEGAKGYLTTVLDGIGSVFKAAWVNVIKPVTDKLGVTDAITTAWQGAEATIGTVVSGIGSILQKGYNGTIKPVIDALGSTEGISAAWGEIRTAVGKVIEWLAEKFDWLMGKLQPVLDGLSWLRDKGAGAVAGIQDIGSGIRSLWTGEDPGQEPAAGGDPSGPTQPPAPQNPRSGKAVPKKVSGSYLGGSIGRGFREVGEQGPETIWTSKGGYVAHANATERLARLSERAGPLLDAIGGGLRSAMSKAENVSAPMIQQVQLAADRIAPAVQPAPAPAAAAPVTIYAQINAQHMTAGEIAEELERRGRAAQAGALYDQAHDYGQYGGA